MLFVFVKLNCLDLNPKLRLIIFYHSSWKSFEKNNCIRNVKRTGRGNSVIIKQECTRPRPKSFSAACHLYETVLTHENMSRYYRQQRKWMFPKQEIEGIVDGANLDLPQAAQPGRVDGCQVLPPQGEDNPGPQERSLSNLRQIASAQGRRK